MSQYFGAIDYMVLVVMLLISVAIGLYFAWKDYRNKATEDSVLTGGKKMSTIPVCISILAGYLGSANFIGLPIVVYITGTQFWVAILSVTIAAIISCELFIPIYYKMNLISVNHYLCQRFKSEKLQIIANISTLIAMIPGFGVEMFAPAIALSIVTDMSINSSILVIGLIVTLYTSLGGLKGVIWTDFFQFGVMIFGLMAVIVRGAHVSGGITESFKKAYIGGRIEFWNMDFDIYKMNSFWNIFLGLTLLVTGVFSTSQIQVQRAICMPNIKTAKRAFYLAIPGLIFIITCIVVLGIVMYARYYDCDPLLTGRVTRPDQLVPYFVLDIFEDDFKGLPGMFVACIFGSSLSTLSSGLNAMATIIWNDYLKKLLHTRVPNSYNIYITKGLTAIIGILSLCIAFGIKNSQNIIEVAISLTGAFGGPIFAIFCLGLFFPWANKWGAGVGLIIGEIIGLLITIGAISNRRNPQSMMLPLSTEKCAERNITVYMQGAPLSMLTNYKLPEYHPEGINVLYHINPFFVPVVGFVISLILGNIISVLTNGNINRKVDQNLVHYKTCHIMEKILPKFWRQFQDERPRDYTDFEHSSNDFNTKLDVNRERNGTSIVKNTPLEEIESTFPLKEDEDQTPIV